jgi:hypothetical protein
MNRVYSRFLDDPAFSLLQLGWTEEFPLPIYHFQSTWNGIKGNGVGFDRESSLLAAIGEMVERSTLLRHPHIKCSNGMAAHTYHQKATENAVFELIERDMFLCHYLTKTSFVDISDHDDIELLPIADKYCRDRGYVLRVGLLTNKPPYVTIATVFRNGGRGCILDTSCKSSLKDSVDNSVLSILCSLANQCNSPEQSLSVAEFLSIPSPGNKDRRRLGLTPESAKSMSDLYETSISYSVSEPPVQELKQGSTIECLGVPPELKGMDFSVVRVSNPSLQSMSMGLSNEDLANYERLARFAGNRDFKLQKLPHPFF